MWLAECASAAWYRTRSASAMTTGSAPISTTSAWAMGSMAGSAVTPKLQSVQARQIQAHARERHGRVQGQRDAAGGLDGGQDARAEAARGVRHELAQPARHPWRRGRPRVRAGRHRARPAAPVRPAPQSPGNLQHGHARQQQLGPLLGGLRHGRNPNDGVPGSRAAHAPKTAPTLPAPMIPMPSRPGLIATFLLLVNSCCELATGGLGDVAGSTCRAPASFRCCGCAGPWLRGRPVRQRAAGPLARDMWCTSGRMGPTVECSSKFTRPSAAMSGPWRRPSDWVRSCGTTCSLRKKTPWRHSSAVLGGPEGVVAPGQGVDPAGRARRVDKALGVARAAQPGSKHLEGVLHAGIREHQAQHGHDLIEGSCRQQDRAGAVLGVRPHHSRPRSRAPGTSQRAARWGPG